MDDNPHHVICPQARKVKNRRSEQAKWRSGKKWKALVKEHCHDDTDAVCVHCKKHHKEPRKNGKLTYLTINHLSRALYLTEELYTTWNEELMEICCTMCNWMYEQGKVSCPVCHNQYISVMEPDGMCQGCYDKAHPDYAAKRKAIQKQKADAKKALLKMLRDGEKARAKEWKATHPLRKKNPEVEPAAKKHADQDDDNSHCKIDKRVIRGCL